ncbi:hypothetical protein Cabther_A1038 [Chloracidobacterium thermophilum B]|uniref:Uncharacterized protein n=2 Tax=Chloracidobacterium thermophilum TaxID=458033 RepID=G2LH50_CHLTF|nr:hypothetical protein Cabther_A1038 [Chloracidobacterium thermophilum B]
MFWMTERFPPWFVTGVGLLLGVWLWSPDVAGQDTAEQKAALKNRASRPSRGRTLDEYFLAIPDSYLPSVPRARRRTLLRPEHVTVRDERNGYLQIAGDGARPTVTVAKFRRSDGTYLIAVTADYEMGSECWLLDEQPGGFVDVTRNLIPDYRRCEDFEAADCHVYELPRYGTTIVVKDGAGRERYRLGWRGNRFERLP